MSKRRNQETLANRVVVRRRLEKYRAKYGIGPDEPKVIHNR